MLIARDHYLHQLINREWNGAIKVITGLRRSGKSFLLFELFKHHLLSQGVREDQIIEIVLDSDTCSKLRDPENLSAYIKGRIADPHARYYLLLDEAQYAISKEEWKSRQDIRLYSVLNGLLRNHNVDVYVTGSNSKFLSTDILTEFRGRGDEVTVNPLTFKEFSSVYPGNPEDAWLEYMTYGGMPRILELKTDEQKTSYLERLFTEIYIRDIVERYGFHDSDVLGELMNILASQTGSLTNPSKLANTYKSVQKKQVSDKTLRSYIDALKDAFLIDEARRYDIKGKAYIGSPFKYYYRDIGLRNARLNFRQQDPGHLMENILYNELKFRGYHVDVGVVKYAEGGKRGAAEVDFVCNQGSKRYYVQSAYTMPDEAKRLQEEASLVHIPDSFRKIIVTGDERKPWHDERGITIIGLRQFLLDEHSLDA